VLPAVAAAGLIVLVLIPYTWLASQRPSHLREGERPPGRTRAWLIRAAVEGQHAARSDHHARSASRRDVALVLPALAWVILASVGMVHAAVSMGDRLSISQAVMGTLVLAVLTSIPNVLAAVRLALHHRGAAVISEAFNSNNANVLAGLCLPAAVLGLGGRGGVGELTVWWAFAITAFAVWLLAAGRGLGRRAGTAIVLVYAVFVAAVLVR
jgi:Ca2+/Na+ antiporter